MMGMQYHRVTIATAQPAALAGVIVAGENSFAPFYISRLAARDVVLQGFIDVSSPLGLIGLLACRATHGKRYGFRNAAMRAIRPFAALRLVLGHGRAALRAWHLHGQAAIANAFCVGLKPRLEAGGTDKAGLPAAMGIRVQVGRAGPAGGDPGWLAESVNCRLRFPAARAGGKRRAVAGVADTVIAAINAALDTKVLSHAAIIP